MPAVVDLEVEAHGPPGRRPFHLGTEVHAPLGSGRGRADSAFVEEARRSNQVRERLGAALDGPRDRGERGSAGLGPAALSARTSTSRRPSSAWFGSIFSNQSTGVASVLEQVRRVLHREAVDPPSFVSGLRFGTLTEGSFEPATERGVALGRAGKQVVVVHTRCGLASRERPGSSSDQQGGEQERGSRAHRVGRSVGSAWELRLRSSGDPGLLGLDESDPDEIRLPRHGLAPSVRDLAFTDGPVGEVRLREDSTSRGPVVRVVVVRRRPLAAQLRVEETAVAVALPPRGAPPADRVLRGRVEALETDLAAREVRERTLNERLVRSTRRQREIDRGGRRRKATSTAPRPEWKATNPWASVSRSSRQTAVGRPSRSTNPQASV